MRVLVLGYNAFDVVVALRGLPRPDSKLEVEAIHLGGGGPGATAAVALARLGAEVRLATVLGDDPGALWQRGELESAGVDLGPSIQAPGCAAPRAVSLADTASEERAILWTRGALPAFPVDQVREEWLHGVDLFYCDGHEISAATVLARAARRLGLPVVMDAGSVRPGVRGLVSACTDVISSTRFAPELTGCGEPESALRIVRDLGPRHVAMTFGADGCLALDGDGMVHVPAFAVPVRDTTGAGDVFHAGYAFALAQGRPWLECLRFGAAAAALKCRGWGGRSALPEADEVEDLLRHGRTRASTPPGWTGR
ncbi:MAG: PfkB family carbohydrate kinase [Candidatus Krumholzibacteriia bacterium]